MFAYCANNPVKYIDASGQSFILGFLFFAVLSIACATPGLLIIGLTIKNQDKIADYEQSIDDEIDDSYDFDEGVSEAEDYLNKKYQTQEIHIIKTDSGVRIIGSYLVTDPYDRLRTTMILERTGLFEHSAQHMASEWVFHNKLAWAYKGAKDADLEYTTDSRWYVEVISGVLQG